MKLDDALEKAFDREALAVPERPANAAEVSRACKRHTYGRARLPGITLGDFAPILALAAAVIVTIRLDPACMMSLRPLASELVVSIPDEAGSRFLDFVLEAGKSYRSLD
jgi:hypothetical protein